MQVKDLMTTHVISVRPDQTLSEVADVLYQYHFTGVPVADSDGILLGIIAERDFIASDSKLYLPTYIKLLTDLEFVRHDDKRLNPAAKKIVNARARDIMNKKVVTAPPDMDVNDLAVLFAEKRVNPMPVVDGNNKIIGIISRSDLIKLLAGPEHARSLEERVAVREIDSQVHDVQVEMKTKFAYVAKFRANIWLTSAIVLFVIGFLAGIIYVVDPEYFVPKDQPPALQQYNDYFSP